MAEHGRQVEPWEEFDHDRRHKDWRVSIQYWITEKTYITSLGWLLLCLDDFEWASNLAKVPILNWPVLSSHQKRYLVDPRRATDFLKANGKVDEAPPVFSTSQTSRAYPFGSRPSANQKPWHWLGLARLQTVCMSAKTIVRSRPYFMVLSFFQPQPPSTKLLNTPMLQLCLPL